MFDRRSDLLGLLQHECEQLVSRHHRRSHRDELPRRLQRGLEIAGLVLIDDFVHERVDRNQSLRIVGHRVARFRRIRSREISERSQSRHLFSGDAALDGRRGSERASENRPRFFDIAAAIFAKVVRFLRIVRLRLHEAARFRAHWPDMDLEGMSRDRGLAVIANGDRQKVIFDVRIVDAGM